VPPASRWKLSSRPGYREKIRYTVLLTSSGALRNFTAASATAKRGVACPNSNSGKGNGSWFMDIWKTEKLRFGKER